MNTSTADQTNTQTTWLPDEQATKAQLALRKYVGELQDLGAARALLGWDQQTKLPKKGAAGRGRALGAIAAVLHERRTSPELDTLIKAVEDEDADAPEGKVMRRSFDRATRLSSDFIREMSETSSTGYVAWEEARAKNDFSIFKPVLEKLVELSRKEAELYGYETEAYDALHDNYEEGSRAADLEPMFEQLRAPINELLDKQPEPDTSILERSWNIAEQERFGVEVVKQLGFDFDAGRIDDTAHPFCISIGEHDVRLTTRYEENWLPSSLFGTIHEAGHGIYEQAFYRLGVPATLADAPGLGMHESQSRGYENIIGRSREFWELWFPHLQKSFPEATKGVTLDDFVASINTAKRSFIRVEADELSYNLHLAVRFELERDLINGKLAVKDLPEAWNTTFERWFGLRPSSDAEGVLQDVHWSSGSFGYFPTYTLGNIYAAQFAETARKDLPNWDQLVANGDFSPIMKWFDEHVYQHGAAFTGRELVQRITGGPVDSQPLIRYLQKRFG